MSGERGTLQYKLHRLIMQSSQSPNYFGNPCRNIMIVREVRTNLSILTPETKGTKNSNKLVKIRSLLKPGDRVQVRNYDSRKIKWNFGRMEEKVDNVDPTVEDQNGQQPVMRESH